MQAFPSLQLPPNPPVGVNTHVPLCGLHASLVQELPSSHVTLVLPVQVPETQVLVDVQPFLSSQLAPSPSA